MRSLTLPAEPKSVARARQLVRQTAPDHAEFTAAAELCTSELVANVIRHARTDVTVTIRLGPPFRIEVHDGVAATDAFRALIHAPPPTAAVSSIGGRGLGIVHSLATRIGLDDDPDGGKVVWFEL